MKKLLKTVEGKKKHLQSKQKGKTDRHTQITYTHNTYTYKETQKNYVLTDDPNVRWQGKIIQPIHNLCIYAFTHFHVHINIYINTQIHSQNYTQIIYIILEKNQQIHIFTYAYKHKHKHRDTP